MAQATSEFLLVAERVIAAEKRPLSAREIVDIALERELFSDKRAGKTPHQTMKSKLSVHMRHHADQSPFVRTAPGRFYLRALLQNGQVIYNAPPLLPPRKTERVLVFPSDWLDSHERFQGIARKWPHRRALPDSTLCSYLERMDAEADETHKQILTYCLVTRSGKVLSYKRGTYNRVENYLRGSRCIGFGGHVTESDRTFFSTDMGLRDSAARELMEELQVPPADRQRLGQPRALRLLGVLNDDSSATGRRHFAFVFQYEVSDDPSWDRPKRGEKAVTQLQWLDPTSSAFTIWDYEYWSQLCFRAFFSGMIRTQPAYRIVRRKRFEPNRRILCVLGPLGSGKTEATRILKEDFRYEEVNSGRVLAEILGMPPVPETPRATFQQAAWSFIQRPEGPSELAQAISDRIGRNPSPRVLIDGVRQLTTLKALQATLGNRRLGLIFVHTPPDAAYNFYRERQGAPLDIHDFLKLRDAPVEQDAHKMIRLADAILYNWAGKPLYRAVVHRLIRDLESENS